MSGFEKFKGRLPNKEKFCCSLTGEKICEKGYERALKVWDRFEMKTMKDYHDLYLKWNAIFLADVFYKFRNSSSRERVKTWFFVTFNIIIGHIFPENFIKIPQVLQKI